MSAGRAMRALLLAGAAFAAFGGSQAKAQAQTATTHEVRKGDTLFDIARKNLPAGVTRNQLIVAIYRANPAAFPGGNINRLEIGTVLVIPAREEVAGILSADADRELQDLLGNTPTVASPHLATARPSPGTQTGARPANTVPLTAEGAAKRYREGLGMEHRGDLQGALTAFLEAGEAGNGMAQLKLGQIYDKGNAVVARDYQVALKWYQKARNQGMEIPKPLRRTIIPQ